MNSSNSNLHTILLVDDNQSVVAALSALLRSAGYAVAAAICAADALTYIRGNLPAAAVIDIHLPDLSGLILTQKIRQQVGEAMPIIILSGDVSMETINSLSQVGATYFFSKPVNPPELLGRLNQLIAANNSTAVAG